MFCFAFEEVVALRQPFKPLKMGKNSSKSKRKARGKKTGNKKGGMPMSSDLAVSAGRGRAVPRMDLGRDTLLGLAQSQRRTLALVGGSSVSGAAGAYAETTFALNNAFSPGFSSSAVGYSKYMAFYTKCFVIGASIRVHGVVIDNASTSGLVCGLTVTTNSTSLGSFQAAVANGMADWTVVFNLPDRVTFNESVDVSKFFNKPRVLDDPQLFSTSGAGPTQLIVVHLWSQALTGATAISMEAGVEILLDCVFTDPIPFT